MREWLTKNLTVTNAIVIATLIVTLVRSGGQFALQYSEQTRDQTRSTIQLGEAVAKLTLIVDALGARVTLSEHRQDRINDDIAKEFPRRSELEPRLKAIEEKVNETNMAVRRMNENSRVPSIRNP